MTAPFLIILTQSAPWWAAAACAGAVSVLAWRSGSLRWDGALAAFAVGTTALLVQWSWGVFLIVWFGLATALSRVGRARKVARTESIVQKGGQRDAVQVLANGGVFALAAVVALRWPATGTTASIAAASALAAAGADTWSTEIGTLFGGAPWSLRSGQRASAGTSGAVTWQGSVGGLAGAVLLAVIAFGVHMITQDAVMPVLIAGIAGATSDTLFGAWIQERRRCPMCGKETERLTHCENQGTVRCGGVPLVSNDAVNVLCSLVGALVGVAVAAQ